MENTKNSVYGAKMHGGMNIPNLRAFQSVQSPE